MILEPARHVRSLLHPHHRALRKLQRSAPGELMQPSPQTRADRHPALFSFVRDRLVSLPEPKLLSFGCSTGEEPCTLARYLPHARIDAIDINPNSMAIARRRAEANGLGQIRFACSGAPDALATGYDAIFCLSVLRHGELDATRPETCTHFMPFSRFLRALEGLDAALRPAGYLVLWGCNFRLADTHLAAGYKALAVAGKKPERSVIYGPDDLLIGEQESSDFVFQKGG